MCGRTQFTGGGDTAGAGASGSGWARHGEQWAGSLQGLCFSSCLRFLSWVPTLTFLMEELWTLRIKSTLSSSSYFGSGYDNHSHKRRKLGHHIKGKEENSHKVVLWPLDGRPLPTHCTHIHSCARTRSHTDRIKRCNGRKQEKGSGSMVVGRGNGQYWSWLLGSWSKSQSGFGVLQWRIT